MSEQSIDPKLYSGSSWLRKELGRDLSPLGERVADLLGWVFAGIYHLDISSLQKADWSNDSYIRLAIWCGGWSTYDFSILTRLVIGCHDLAIRMEINPCNFHCLELLFHARQREGSVWERHPTIEQAIEAARRES